MTMTATRPIDLNPMRNREQVWDTPYARTEMVDGLAFPVFEREAREGDGIFEVMSSLHGDQKLMWDPNNASEVADIKRSFDAAVAEGRRPFRVDKDGNATDQLREFDPTIGKMIILPRIVGG